MSIFNNTVFQSDKSTQEVIFDLLMWQWKDIAINLFIWNGLPKTLKPEIMEQLLYEYGKLLFFKDKDKEDLILTLPFEFQDEINLYGECERYRAFGHNYNKMLTKDNSVIIRNNRLMIPTRFFIEIYCLKMANLESAIDVNIENTKTPVIFEGQEKALLSMKTVYNKINKNEPVFYKVKMKGEDFSLNALNTGVEFISDKYMDLYKRYENRLLSYLGLNNSDIDKAERVNVQETNSNDEFIKGNFQRMLKSRKTACEEINSMFPELNITVQPNPEIFKEPEPVKVNPNDPVYEPQNEGDE